MYAKVDNTNIVSKKIGHIGFWQVYIIMFRDSKVCCTGFYLNLLNSPSFVLLYLLIIHVYMRSF